MRVAVTGSTGLIGTALVESLRVDGHEVVRLVRRSPAEPDEVIWDPGTGEIDAAALAGTDAVVHLAGEPIGARRWTEAQKRRIRDSRVDGTRVLAEALAGLDESPAVLACASGIDYYGDRGDEMLTEDSTPGDSFLAEVCVAWEAAADPARDAGIRTVHLRQGLVLSRDAPAVRRLLLVFKIGLGGRFGSGRQYWTWITIDDLVALYRFAIEGDALSGPVNAVASAPVTNAEFTRTLARVLNRPALIPIPRFGPKLVLGELAETLLFHSQRAVPQKATDAGFVVQHADLEGALRHVLGR